MLGSDYLGSFYLGEGFSEQINSVNIIFTYNPYDPYIFELPFAQKNGTTVTYDNSNSLFHTDGQVLQVGQYLSRREGNGQ